MEPGDSVHRIIQGEEPRIIDGDYEIPVMEDHSDTIPKKENNTIIEEDLKVKNGNLGGTKN